MKIFRNIKGYDGSITGKKKIQYICVDNLKKCRNITVGEPEKQCIGPKAISNQKRGVKWEPYKGKWEPNN